MEPKNGFQAKDSWVMPPVEIRQPSLKTSLSSGEITPDSVGGISPIEKSPLRSRTNTFVSFALSSQEEALQERSPREYNPRGSTLLTTSTVLPIEPAPKSRHITPLKKLFKSTTQPHSPRHSIANDRDTVQHSPPPCHPPLNTRGNSFCFSPHTPIEKSNPLPTKPTSLSAPSLTSFAFLESPRSSLSPSLRNFIMDKTKKELKGDIKKILKSFYSTVNGENFSITFEKPIPKERFDAETIEKAICHHLDREIMERSDNSVELKNHCNELWVTICNSNLLLIPVIVRLNYLQQFLAGYSTALSKEDSLYSYVFKLHTDITNFLLALTNHHTTTENEKPTRGLPTFIYLYNKYKNDKHKKTLNVIINKVISNIPSNVDSIIKQLSSWHSTEGLEKIEKWALLIDQHYRQVAEAIKQPYHWLDEEYYPLKSISWEDVLRRFTLGKAAAGKQAAPPIYIKAPPTEEKPIALGEEKAPPIEEMLIALGYKGDEQDTPQTRCSKILPQFFLQTFEAGFCHPFLPPSLKNEKNAEARVLWFKEAVIPHLQRVFLDVQQDKLSFSTSVMSEKISAEEQKAITAITEAYIDICLMCAPSGEMKGDLFFRKRFPTFFEKFNFRTILTRSAHIQLKNEFPYYSVCYEITISNEKTNSDPGQRRKIAFEWHLYPHISGVQGDVGLKWRGTIFITQMSKWIKNNEESNEDAIYKWAIDGVLAETSSDLPRLTPDCYNQGLSPL